MFTFVSGDGLGSVSSLLGFLYMLIFIPFGLVITVLTHMKRNDPTLKQRLYSLVLIEHVGGLICIFSSASIPLVRLPARVRWNSFLLFPLVTVSVLIRSYVYCFRYYLTQERSKILTTPRLMRYTRFIRPSFLLASWGVSVSFLLILMIIGSILFSQLQQDADLMMMLSCPWDGAIFVIDMIIGAIILMLSIGVLVFMRKARDYYKIKQEMVISIVGWMIAMTLLSITLSLEVEMPFSKSGFFLILGLQLPFLLYAWILAGIYRNDAVKISPDMEFQQILDNPKARDKFRSFLVYQLCVENIMFWEDVQRYKNGDTAPIMTEEDTIQMARIIHEKYIRNDSMYQVNISSHIQHTITDTINRQNHHPSSSLSSSSRDDVTSSTPDGGSGRGGGDSGDGGVPTRSLFDAAENEVLGMMRFHSFPLFLLAHQSSSSSGGGGVTGTTLSLSSSSSSADSNPVIALNVR
eukprot:TRINITY_DN9560_c0_g1_i2.p1 TRINITY_DN9560_c0_g1~~TRINITY_DN9560_c0_g1_i2.p1  ORF type:complete len:464 (-),score=70.24 TRINITY_DN9560_c0_g1_i2:26-1417(-)